MKKQSQKWLKKIKPQVTETEFLLIKHSVEVLEINTYEKDKYKWGKYEMVSPGIIGFGGIWNWDSAFHALGVSRWDTDLAQQQIEGFLQFIMEDGMLPDVVFSTGEIEDRLTKPPVLASAAAYVYKKSQDIEFLKRVYPILIKNEHFWVTKRCKNGMFHYEAVKSAATDEETYLKLVGWETGWDNSVRWDKTPHKLWAIDLNCYMIAMYRALAFMAEELSLHSDCAMWREKEKNLTELVETKLWNNELGAYVDVNFETGEMSDVLSPASFMPLFINTASKERAAKMAEIAKNHFYPGMPTVAYDNPGYSNDYWRGPCWLNVAFFAIKGLYNYGYNEVADGIKNTIMKWMEQNDDIHENYDAKTGKGLSGSKFSWSSVFIIEFILGIKDCMFCND